MYRIKAELTHDVSFHRNNLKKIINFYLIECPVEGKSFLGISFKDKGWAGQTKFATLRRKMLEGASPELKNNYYPSKPEELKTNLAKCENLKGEYAVFLKNDEKRVISSLYSAIRNAFAHGSFDVRTYNKKTVYFFANYDKYLKAQLILNESTLLSWIKTFNSIEK